MSSRKQRGHDTQRIVAAYLRGHGFPHAESAGAGRAGTDVTGCPGLDIEVKARRDLDLPGLMRQLADRAVDGVLGVGVVRGDGQGPATVEDWPVVLRLADAVRLLRAAGYGDQAARTVPDLDGWAWEQPTPSGTPTRLRLATQNLDEETLATIAREAAARYGEFLRRLIAAGDAPRPEQDGGTP